MPPISSKTIAEESDRYGFPFIGDISERLSERLDISELHDTDFVDSDGYLIPGTPFRLNGSQNLVPIDGADQEVRGITLEAVKVAESDSETDLDAADDFDVVIVTAGTVDRAIVEGNIGRSLSTNEIDAINEAKRLVLTDPET